MGGQDVTYYWLLEIGNSYNNGMYSYCMMAKIRYRVDGERLREQSEQC